MDKKNFENTIFESLPEKIECSNFYDCVFNASTNFVKCNLIGCVFNKESTFDRSNVITREEYEPIETLN